MEAEHQSTLELFIARTDSEIRERILPRLKREPGFRDELLRSYYRERLGVEAKLQLVGQCAQHMAKGERDAFEYLVYRDLNKLLELYLEFADKQIPEASPIRVLAAAA